MKGETTIKTTGLETGYQGKSISSEINIHLNKGELIALIGINGSGKSTFLRTLAGIQKKINGQIFIQGKQIDQYKPTDLSRIISFVSTENSGAEQMSAEEMVAMGRFPYTNWLGKLSENDKKIIKSAISDAGIEPFSKKNIHELSDGERQRVMIARAVAQDTDVIILDEPTAFLDIPNKYSIFKLLQQQSHANNKAVLFSTHDLNMAIEFADTIWLISEGNISAGSPEDLILQGVLEKSFINSDIYFDKEKLTFLAHKTNYKKINLRGNGFPFTLTKHALNRAGFDTDENNTETITVTIEKNNNDYHWVITKENLNFVFSSISEMIQKIKENNQPIN